MGPKISHEVFTVHEENANSVDKTPWGGAVYFVVAGPTEEFQSWLGLEKNVLFKTIDINPSKQQESDKNFLHANPWIYVAGMS